MRLDGISRVAGGRAAAPLPPLTGVRRDGGRPGHAPNKRQAGDALLKALAATDSHWVREWQSTAAMLEEAREAARGFKAAPAGSGARLRALQVRMKARVAEVFPPLPDVFAMPGPSEP